MTPLPTSPELERAYTTSHGVAAEFRMPSGTLVTLEPQGEWVTLGWSVEDVCSLAQQLGSLAQDSQVYVAQDHDLSKLRHAVVLQRVLEQAPDRGVDIELVRIHHPDRTVIWAAGESPNGNELSVTARSWQEAGRLAIELDAEDVATALPELVGSIPELPTQA